jgi:putative phosphoribosyl transferase
MSLMYRDRTHAGEVLAAILFPILKRNPYIFVIPNGGVPVAVPILKKLQKNNLLFEYAMLIVKKIYIPNTTAGFGAITIDREILLNGLLVTRMEMHPNEIQRLTAKTLREVERREAEYGIEKQEYNLEGRQTVIIDEGLPSGITMMAAIRSLQKFHPSELIVAIPTASQMAITQIEPEVSQIICPNVRKSFFFSTAQAYAHYSRVNIEMVKKLLKEVKAVS